MCSINLVELIRWLELHWRKFMTILPALLFLGYIAFFVAVHQQESVIVSAICYAALLLYGVFAIVIFVFGWIRLLHSGWNGKLILSEIVLAGFTALLGFLTFHFLNGSLAFYLGVAVLCLGLAQCVACIVYGFRFWDDSDEEHEDHDQQQEADMPNEGHESTNHNESSQHPANVELATPEEDVQVPVGPRPTGSGSAIREAPQSQ